MSFWRSTQPVAAKQHKCEACGSIIQVGEKHWMHAGMSDGDFYSYRLCNPCDAFIVFLHTGDFGFDDGVDLHDLKACASDVLDANDPQLLAFSDRRDGACNARAHLAQQESTHDQ